MRLLLFSFAFFIVLAGCRKEEDALEPILTDTINLNDLYGNRFAEASMGVDYEFQAYFSLVNNQLVGTFDKFAWDIALTNDDEPQLLLNSSIINLRIAEAGDDWDAPIDPASLEWKYDLPGRQPEDLAIGSNWNQVLVVDRGVDASGVARGMKKFVLQATENGYTLTVAELDGSNEQSFTAVPDDQYNFTAWSFDTGNTVVEPPKDTWDIVFTSYLFVFDPINEPNPYQVTGALLNMNARQGARFDDTPFESITADAATIAQLTTQQDVIGYDWKEFDFDLGFIIIENRSYVVKCADEALFALSFTGFYDEDGNRGTPAFIYRRLQE